MARYVLCLADAIPLFAGAASLHCNCLSPLCHLSGWQTKLRWSLTSTSCRHSVVAGVHFPVDDKQLQAQRVMLC